MPQVPSCASIGRSSSQLRELGPAVVLRRWRYTISRKDLNPWAVYPVWLVTLNPRLWISPHRARWGSLRSGSMSDVRWNRVWMNYPSQVVIRFSSQSFTPLVNSHSFKSASPSAVMVKMSWSLSNSTHLLSSSYAADRMRCITRQLR